ncbi:hypothetical protein [Enorma phocaeensis]|uniref:hypothetical protein n=1 Tax=Enorma phocaeensis TaxID=1871019 RepID=UPI00320BB14D
MLTGFEPLTIASGGMRMTVTRNGVSFSKGAVEKLHGTGYVQPMIDRAGKRFAIVACGEDAENAKKFFRGGDISNGVRWNERDLITTFSVLVGKDLENEGVTVDGVYLEEDDALIFDFNNAHASRKPREKKG